MSLQSGPWFDERSMGIVPDPEVQEAGQTAGSGDKGSKKKGSDKAKGDSEGKKGIVVFTSRERTDGFQALSQVIATEGNP